ncbi:MAG: hypothetical protein KDA65_17250 [Planctomycetaceae bacterium]|nr:hypothetical protein [Planctomycetaceae bacterium]
MIKQEELTINVPVSYPGNLESRHYPAVFFKPGNGIDAGEGDEDVEILNCKERRE